MPKSKMGKIGKSGKKTTVPPIMIDVHNDKDNAQPPLLPPSPAVTACSTDSENGDVDNGNRLHELRNKRSLFKKKKKTFGTRDVQDDMSVAVSVFSFANRRSNTRKKPELLKNDNATNQPQRCNSKARELGFCEGQSCSSTNIQVGDPEQIDIDAAEQSKRNSLKRECSVEVSLSNSNNENGDDTSMDRLPLRPALRQEKRYSRKSYKGKKSGKKKNSSKSDNDSFLCSDNESIFSDASSHHSKKTKKSRRPRNRKVYDEEDEGSSDESTHSREDSGRAKRERTPKQQDPFDACAMAIYEVIFG